MQLWNKDGFSCIILSVILVFSLVSDISAQKPAEWSTAVNENGLWNITRMYLLSF